jgi:hypothetical protein
MEPSPFATAAPPTAVAPEPAATELPPTAIDPNAPDAFPWQAALVSSAVLAALPELQPANAGVVERLDTLAVSAQLMSNITRYCRDGIVR